jgi:hypothetical protein
MATADDINKFHEDGYMVLKDVLPVDIINEALVAATNNFNSCLALIAERNLEFGMHAKNGFKEIVERNENRYEMQYGMDESPIFQSPVIMNNEKLTAVLDGIFGQDVEDGASSSGASSGDSDAGDASMNRSWRLCSRSIVLAKPGALEQQWHVDGAHVDVHTHRPCHVLNVRIHINYFFN